MVSDSPAHPPEPPAAVRQRWRVNGRVQGVGFRPFVHRLAHAWRLSGFVYNDVAGVVIEAQGQPQQLRGFGEALVHEPPPLAEMQEIHISEIGILPAEDDFIIRPSVAADVPRAQVTPDLALCSDCLRELHDRREPRRHGYPLINCTHCGPRFSIVRDVPYDRPNTTMAAFAMCPSCSAEYSDPADRRFHAQPIACHTCGPRVMLLDVGSGQAVAAADPISAAAQRLAAGAIVAVKGIGGFHLAVRADDESAVRRLRGRKGRVAKPFAVMVRSLDDARRIVRLGKRAAALMASPAAPIVLAPRRADARIAAAVAPQNHRLGVMLAYTPLHHLLFDAADGRFGALVMTSANDSDEPLIFTDGDAVARLGGMCDAILLHERPIERPVDDSVVLDAGHEREPIVLRRSRGFVPSPIRLPEGLRAWGLCVGADLKNAVAIVRDDEVIPSQHLGDLAHVRTYGNFRRAVDDLLRLYQVEPQWVAHDLHPTYVSTTFGRQLARSWRVPSFGFQHHHAHAASVLAEHGEAGPVLAVVCDGTGYGADHTIWGGELLIASLDGFERAGHLRPLQLAGGDAAARQTWRSALALLLAAYGEPALESPLTRRLGADPEELAFVGQMLRRGVNCIASSSAGRVFDGVAALLGLCSCNQFEAQAPSMLESAAAEAGELPSDRKRMFKLDDGADGVEIDLSPLVRHVVDSFARGTPAQELAALFHAQFAAAWEAAVLRAAERTGLTCIVLSGGVFCNEILDRELTRRLAGRGMRVLRHRAVPPNDGGLALGQAALAARRVAVDLALSHDRKVAQPCV